MELYGSEYSRNRVASLEYLKVHESKKLAHSVTIVFIETDIEAVLETALETALEYD
jgi:hypothetical protein